MLITNENIKNTVTNIANHILPDCDEVFIEVGYFYFSGFQEIYEQLKDKKIKVIVGMSYDQGVSNAAKTAFAIRENYFEKVADSINNTDLVDQSLGEQQFNLFVEKLRNGSMEIRCNPKKNDHSKRYVFKFSKERNQGGTLLGRVLFGSSNWTRSGFGSNIEGNELFSENDRFIDHHKYFLSQWEKAIDIANADNLEEFNTKVTKRTWINHLEKPHKLFIKVLDEYFKERDNKGISLPKEITDGEMMNLKYQEDAIVKGLEVLKKHQGVILADVVGLGKSIIATGIAKNLNLNTIVICPPHLIKSWEGYLTSARVAKNVVSRGSIKSAEKFILNRRENLIIIDEAHSFRNDLTSDYLDLHKLCKSNKVMLLSATPFNNKPQDTFNMIKLFQIPTRSSIQTVENLSERFKDLVKQYNQLKDLDENSKKDLVKIKILKSEISQKIRQILSPLVIRRSRLDLQNIDRYREDLKNQNIEFPIRRDPVLINYELNELTDIYIETLETISPKNGLKVFQGTRYKSTSYVKAECIADIQEREDIEDKQLLKTALENIADFMKRLLVRRFESCIYSFMSSLDHIIDSTVMFKKYYEIGVVPIFKKGNIPDLEDFLSDSDDQFGFEEINNLPDVKNLKSKGLWFIKKEELKDTYYKHLINDIKILKNLRDKWKKILTKDFNDPKLNKFKEVLREQIKSDPKRKILIFSEFADTADYLFISLNKEFKIFKYTSADSSEKRRDIIKENFDASNKNQKDDFDILVATDAIAEGFNLNRAGTIFNYDIPYNPTKVIQRIGRINRINKKMFDELYIYNFFPTETGEKEVRTKKIAKLKISMFKALFGDDTKVLTKDEEIESFFIDEMKELDVQEENSEIYFENMIYNLRDQKPELIAEVRKITPRIRIRREIKTRYNKNVLVYAKKGEESVFRFVDEKLERLDLPIEKYLEILKADENEEPHVVTENFDSKYRSVTKSLFDNNYITALDIRKRRSIETLKMCIEKCSRKYKEYLEDLIKVIQEYDDLPGGYLKRINRISKKTAEKEVEELTKEITHEYISKSFEKADRIDQEKEHIIISEEFSNA